MRHIKTIALLVFLAVQLRGVAQIPVPIQVVTDNYPDIELVYHDFAPEVLDKSAFQLSEGKDNRNIVGFEILNEDHSSKPLTILFLWEDMARFDPQGRMIFRQFEFTKNTLVSFFDNMTSRAGHRFGVQVFNRTENGNTLTPIVNGFSSDKAAILNSIKQYSPDKRTFSPYPVSSDLYSAIRQGSESLGTVNGAKCIVVFTAGYANKSSGATSGDIALRRAQELHIPVYVFQYYEGHGKADISSDFAASTFGIFKSYKDSDQGSAISDLRNLYPVVADRYFGNSYKITYRTSAQMGNTHTVLLRANGKEIHGQFKIGLIEWCKGHMGYTVAALALLVVALILIVYFTVRTRRKIAENRESLTALERQRIEDNESASQKQRELEEKIQDERENAAREKKKQADSEEQQRLHKMMRVKNLYPRLQCVVGETKFTYTVGQVVTTIGRADYNDVVLKGVTVSRDHAVIRFTGAGFEITNKSRTNPIVVNGGFVESTLLKNGDIVGLGEALITFYL